ncbi:hypothetical protein NM688_g640 [Phlebia brevispora]|uniref:Uncharacterized protein n=1 Tax=Phlebia brevispora TaxID=194682 RepID=A0ACC1TE26_9APHY|nr:hypothetical protein NM688_g640 [Phlebia brevispora]
MANIAPVTSTAEKTPEIYRQRSICKVYPRDVSKRYDWVHLAFPKCCSCEKGAVQKCRFKEFRILVLEDPPSITFGCTTTTAEPQYPHVFTIMHDRQLIAWKKDMLRSALRPILDNALNFESRESSRLIRHVRDIHFNELCDFCATTLFSCAWFCRSCGREYCEACWEDQGHSIICCKETDTSLSPVTRFAEGELRTLIDDMNKLEALQAPWTPSGFMHMFGSQKCTVQDCESEREMKTTISEFFSNFGHAERRGKFASPGTIWKLKDWPPTEEFRHCAPELFGDYLQASLVPSFTNPNGAFNLAAHIPRDAIRPDLGPKMYNAFASPQDEDHHGSTRLHIDICEAVNYLTYAVIPTTDEAELKPKNGAANWVIVHRDDTERLVEYLGRTHRSSFGDGDNPIHTQKCFLTPNNVDEIISLGIRAYTICQSVGDAIFIPAGCPHQVSNTSDAMKIACDFLSPAGIGASQKLASEFRQQRIKHGWPADVLQLENLLYFAYCSLNVLWKGLEGNKTETISEASFPSRKVILPSDNALDAHKLRKALLKAKKIRKHAAKVQDRPYSCPGEGTACARGMKFLAQGLLDHMYVSLLWSSARVNHAILAASMCIERTSQRRKGLNYSDALEHWIRIYREYISQWTYTSVRAPRFSLILLANAGLALQNWRRERYVACSTPLLLTLIALISSCQKLVSGMSLHFARLICTDDLAVLSLPKQGPNTTATRARCTSKGCAITVAEREMTKLVSHVEARIDKERDEDENAVPYPLGRDALVRGFPVWRRRRFCKVNDIAADRFGVRDVDAHPSQRPCRVHVETGGLEDIRITTRPIRVGCLRSAQDSYQRPKSSIGNDPTTSPYRAARFLQSPNGTEYTSPEAALPRGSHIVTQALLKPQHVWRFLSRHMDPVPTSFSLRPLPHPKHERVAMESLPTVDRPAQLSRVLRTPPWRPVSTKAPPLETRAAQWNSVPEALPVQRTLSSLPVHEDDGSSSAENTVRHDDVGRYRGMLENISSGLGTVVPLKPRAPDALPRTESPTPSNELSSSNVSEEGSTCLSSRTTSSDESDREALGLTGHSTALRRDVSRAQVQRPPLPQYEPQPPMYRSFGRNKKPQDQRTSRFGNSFDYTWAPRPPPEEVFQRLKEYFPKHDVDEPAIEAASGSTSPTSVEPDPLPQAEPGARSLSVEIPRTASDKDDSRQIPVVEALGPGSGALKDLDQPNIVQCLGFGIFLDYVFGGSIAGCLRRHGKFDEEVTKSFIGQILSGLGCLHSRAFYTET